MVINFVEEVLKINAMSLCEKYIYIYSIPNNPSLASYINHNAPFPPFLVQTAILSLSYTLNPFTERKKNCERKLPFPRRHGNALVTRSARSRVQPANHYAATVLCARQLPVLYIIRMCYYATCLLHFVVNW